MKLDCQEILKWTETQLKYDHDVSLQEASPQALHQALGKAVMMAMADRWSDAKKARKNSRKAFYISAEYLIGRLVYSNLFNLGILDEMKQLFRERGVDLAILEDIEDDALGNGGLGRLAACFLDSAVSCDIPLSGYGLRYRFGLFKQRFNEEGSQVEMADDWTKYGDPWSYRRYMHTVKIDFPDHTVLAVPYDVPVIGYGTKNIGTLRLWQCEAQEELDFDAFNRQDYQRALDAKNRAEDITRVLYPNGITPRRWMGLCNPELCQLITDKIGGDFLKNLEEIAALKPMINDQLIEQFQAVKRIKKQQLCDVIEKREGIRLNPDFIFDVQVKRLHEYKRQLMNILSVVDIYFRLKEGRLPDFQPTVYLFGAKSAPGYGRAKAVIRYINRVAKLINNDPAVADKLKVVFVQNYNCSYAEHIIPAADISEQISPAGTEASGTGNMKLMLNGAVTLGTLDGANVEIAQEAGMENEYIFGYTVEQINALKDSYRARSIYKENADLRRALDTMVDGTVPTDDAQKELYTSLLDGASWHKADHYYILLDYASYLDAKLQANRDYADRKTFGRKCLMNVASAAKFSADRTICQYAEEIWHITKTQY